MPFKIDFLDFDEEDTGEIVGMVLDQQFEDLVNAVIPEEWKETLPEPVADLMPGIAAFVLKKWIFKPRRGDLLETALRGIMKKNIAEVITAQWFVVEETEKAEKPKKIIRR